MGSCNDIRTKQGEWYAKDHGVVTVEHRIAAARHRTSNGAAKELCLHAAQVSGVPYAGHEIQGPELSRDLTQARYPVSATPAAPNRDSMRAGKRGTGDGATVCRHHL